MHFVPEAWTQQLVRGRVAVCRRKVLYAVVSVMCVCGAHVMLRMCILCLHARVARRLSVDCAVRAGGLSCCVRQGVRHDVRAFVRAAFAWKHYTVPVQRVTMLLIDMCKWAIRDDNTWRPRRLWASNMKERE